MLENAVILILLLGDSQTAGHMGKVLEENYDVPGIEVVREAASGKGVDYFLKSLPRSEDVDVDMMSYRQRTRIKQVSTKADYIIFGSLGGNDASRGCCKGRARKKLLLKYKKLYTRLCSLGSIVIFNGSPRAQGRRLSSFDKRRQEVDKIQEEASKGTCVIRNSTRQMNLPADPDGYHYNRSGRSYASFLMTLPGMSLPLQENSQL